MEALFGDEPALGKSITLNGDEKYRIVGIVDNFKPRGEYQKAGPVIFTNESSVEHALNTILVKVKPGVGAEFESSLLKELNATAKGVSIEVSHVIDQRRTQHNLVKVPIGALAQLAHWRIRKWISWWQRFVKFCANQSVSVNILISHPKTDNPRSAELTPKPFG